MAINQLTSNLVKNQFPDFFKEDAPNFLLFIKAYYEYMEQSGKAVHELNKAESYKDIDLTLDEYVEYFRRTILPSIPLNVLADKRLLAKTIRDFYQSKGTFDSYKFLFRILYDEDIEVNYPADQMLKVSDGDWRIDQYVVIASNEQAYDFIGKTIQGVESSAEAFVENVVRRFLGGRDLMQLTLSKLKGNFRDLEPIKIKTATAGTGFEPTIEAGINTFDIASRGSQYQPGDEIDLISSTSGRLGKAVVTGVLTQAGIINYSITDGGSGYTSSTESPGTIIQHVGGDGLSDSSFIISTGDITDTFAISRNIDMVGSNNVFGANAAVISYSPISDPTAARPANLGRRGDTFANTVLSSPSYGFAESNETVAAASNFRTNANAVMKVANTRAFNCAVGIPLYGVTSGANAVITNVQSSAAGALLLRVDTYKDFTGTEAIKVGSKTGNTIGPLVSGKFFANTIGYHVLQVGNVNSQTIAAGDELIGGSSGSFGIVKKVITSVNNGYLYNGTANTSLSGTITTSGNTVTGSGTAFTSNFAVGDAIKSGAQAGRRIFSIASDTSLVTASQFSPALSSATTYGKGGNYRNLLKLQVTANTSANLTSQFDAGPMKPFVELENLKKVGSATVVGNVAYTTSNTQIENIYTKLSDALVFKSSTFGTIDDLSLKVGGAGYSVAPTVTVSNPQIASLEIRDVFLHLQNTASNWGTSNSHITTFDTNDRIEQASTGAKGDVKQIPTSSPQQYGTLTTTTYSNTTIETVIRVFQDELQAVSDLKYANNSTTAVKFYTSASQDTLAGTGSAKIVKVVDNGVLGKNATITATVGANGALSSVRTLDSGFGYKHNEVITFSATTRADSTSGTAKLTVKNAANAEGYYASNRSQVSTKRGFIQDSYRYQEFSYEISSGIAFNRYKDLVDNLVHPSGQILFGQFTTRTPLNMNLSTVADNRTRKKSNGTIAIAKTKASNTVNITNGSFTVTASGGLFRGTTAGATGNITRIPNEQFMVVETNLTPGTANSNKFYVVKVNANTTASLTTANLVNKWAYGTVTTANVYFANSFHITGSSSTLSAEFANNDVIVIETPYGKYNQIKLNKVNSATSANLTSIWTLADVSGANAYYYTGTVS